MWRVVKLYRSATGGQMSVLMALAIVPLLLAAGAALDYNSAVRLRVELQASLDAAAMAMATASEQPDEDRKAIGEKYFKQNLAGTALAEIEPQILIDEDTITVSARYDYPTSFMHLGGIDQMILDETSKVMRPFAGSAEVVLVLDYSGSMNTKNKYQDMRDAATQMINDLDGALDAGHFKVGIVPFSAMVRTSMDKSYVNQVSATQTWTGCTQDRKYPYNTNVDTPTSNVDTKWGYIDGNGENGPGYGCAAYQNKKLTIQPLTDNVSSVTSALADMKPLGNTNISLGTEFGWNLLDPQLPYDNAAPYSDKLTRKFLVLLTDGVQTSSEFGSDNSRSVPAATNNLVEICDNIRAKKITIFTIAYDVTDPDVTDLLKACAPGRYYEPSASGSEISAVFSQIKNQIKNRIARVAK
ncbi:MAG: VWA domain-containing protein [Alphaproteobacteria bacterium]|nr:VWA domain-containing protein [Alphaproteobacteria bacterium]